MRLQQLIFSGLLCFIFLFTSCKKSEEETWYFYDQTKCADVWDTYLVDTTYAGLIEYHFSETTEITIDEVQILDDGGVEQSCEACSCTTGTRIRVKADLQFEAAMEAEGFELE